MSEEEKVDLELVFNDKQKLLLHVVLASLGVCWFANYHEVRELEIAFSLISISVFFYRMTRSDEHHRNQ